jgi:hypothetical protein
MKFTIRKILNKSQMLIITSLSMHYTDVSEVSSPKHRNAYLEHAQKPKSKTPTDQ